MLGNNLIINTWKHSVSFFFKQFEEFSNLVKFPILVLKLIINCHSRVLMQFCLNMEPTVSEASNIIDISLWLPLLETPEATVQSWIEFHTYIVSSDFFFFLAMQQELTSLKLWPGDGRDSRIFYFPNMFWWSFFSLS